ncbi:glycosyl hydrolase family 16 [Schaalia georgiae F0490]|uniref:Glycosyl hydrolase family 16 n=1 Tax=Schaalia georgiae F0490 TaxID=1125717 RepID=J0NE82_9ACTO|nr:glycoside hydrolase family 16 protein [Schaalia georgiae]EJF42967.1 glycosyl hydrolase family 16 [Schaalia georgiae F0490]
MHTYIKRPVRALGVALALALAFPGVALAASATRAAVQDEGPSGYRLVWHDEFDGDRLDSSNWDYQLGGWGDNTQQVYRRENVSVHGGSLHLTGKYSPGTPTRDGGTQTTSSRDFTSGFVQSKNLRAFTYGYFVARVKLPKSRSSWSAFWLSPQNGAYGGWPRSGEIDVFESKGSLPGFVQSNAHWFSEASANPRRQQRPNNSTRNTTVNTQDGFHTYALQWEPTKLTFFLDGAKTHEITGPFTGMEHHGAGAPFDSAFFLRLNHAIGGKFLGDTPYQDAHTARADYEGDGADMEVDYVRVFQRATDTLPPGGGSSSGGKWVGDARGWWWRRADGTFPSSTSMTINGRIYRFDSSGYMRTGWVLDNGYWYYHDASGAQRTGWINTGGHWYHLGSGGAMEIGWVQVGGSWYYLGASGAMTTGWQKIEGSWYYMDSNGVMLTGTHWIDGAWRTFNSSGVWIG